MSDQSVKQLSWHHVASLDELPEGGGVLTPALALGAILRTRLSAAEHGEVMRFRVLTL